MFYAILGVLSGLTIFSGYLVYILHVIQKKTQPHRVTWLVFSILNLIDFANQAASGATNSLWPYGSAFIATLAIFVLSFLNGEGGYSRKDLLVLSGALMGLVLWAVLRTPLASILTNILVATLALIPTFSKAFRDPQSETKFSWFTASLSGFLATASIHEARPVLYILPLYGGLIEGALFALLIIRQQQTQKAPKGSGLSTTVKSSV